MKQKAKQVQEPETLTEGQLDTVASGAGTKSGGLGSDGSGQSTSRERESGLAGVTVYLDVNGSGS